MRVNRHTGTVYVKIKDCGEVPIRFDWDALAGLHGALGKDWETEVHTIIGDLNTKGMAAILGVGTCYDADWWMEKSPPFVPMAHAIREALQLAFFGPDGPETNPRTGLLSKIRSLLPLKPGSRWGAGKKTSSA